MAYVNTTRASDFNLIERFNAFRADLSEKAAQRKVFRQTFNELSDLTNRELNDLGISRSAIKRIAIEAAYGKNA